MTKTFIDAETGEILELAEYKTPEQVEQTINKKAREQEIHEHWGAVLHCKNNKTDKHFNFVEMERDAMLNKLTNKQLGYFLVLQSYVDYKNMLRRPEGSTLPMRKVDMRRVLHISKSETLNNVLDVFEEYGLVHWEIVTMYEKEYKAYFVNEAYCFKKGLQSKFSSRKTSKAVKLFTEDLQELYAQKQVKPADIGFIYKCIQFVHFDTNFLVFNPNERDRAIVEPHTVKSLANATGITQQEVNKKLASLRYPVDVDGQTLSLHVFAKIKVGRTVTYKINPLLVYRQEGVPTPAEYTEFLMSYYREQSKANK